MVWIPIYKTVEDRVIKVAAQRSIKSNDLTRSLILNSRDREWTACLFTINNEVSICTDIMMLDLRPKEIKKTPEVRLHEHGDPRSNI